jgi:acyl carrier protein
MSKKKVAAAADEGLTADVKTIVADHLIVDENEITPGSLLEEDLGADGLDVVELVMMLEERFNIVIDDAQGERLKTFQNVLDLVEKLTAERGKVAVNDERIPNDDAAGATTPAGTDEGPTD